MRSTPPNACHHGATAQKIALRVVGLPEAPMRLGAIVEGLIDGSPYEGVSVLEDLIRGAIRREVPCVSCYDCMVEPEPLAEALGRARLEEFLECGLELGCTAALQWLRGVLYPETPKASVDSKRLIHWGLREMSLGDRRALARRAKGDTLSQLLVDPDPEVIHNLLNNPRTTEALVLRICSRRPQVPPPLRVVIQSRRWIQRYRVKLALVKNPYLELRYGLNLLVYLKPNDLMDVRQDASLSGILRLGAQRTLDLLEGAPS